MYTRIYAGYENISDWADQDEILRVMNDMYNNADFNQVVAAIGDTIAGLYTEKKILLLKLLR